MATNADSPKGYFINKMIELQDSAEKYVAKYARMADAIEVTVIILSVVTSGGLWALAADALPKQLGWGGAAISTVVTFLTIYMYASGLQKKRKKALVVHAEITRYLGQIRGAASIADDDFWQTYKDFEGRLVALKFEREE
jgi:hypothetical protein